MYSDFYQIWQISHAARWFLVCASLTLISVASAQPAADPYREVLSYQISQPRTAVMAIEAELRSAPPAQWQLIEAKLLQILQSPEATPDAKNWVCRQLRQVGSEKAVPPLGALLADKNFAAAAQFALRSITSPKADEVLRESLGKVPRDLRTGVIQTIGARGDRKAVALLAPLVSDADAAIAEAALRALGQVGGDAALKAIQTANIPERLAGARAHALLLCAESLMTEDRAIAARIYHDLYQNAPTSIIKIGALRGIALADKTKAAAVLTAALRDGQPELRAAAAKFVCELTADVVLAQTLADAAALPVDIQVTIFSAANDPAALPAARAAVKSPDPAVRLAALGALGRLGQDADVMLLLGIAAVAEGNEKAAARKAIQKLRAVEVDARLIAAAQKGEPAWRMEAIRNLVYRKTAAVPELLKLAGDAEQGVRTESFKALGEVASLNVLPQILKVLGESGPDRPAAEAAAIAICQRGADKEGAATMVLAAWPGPSAVNQPVRCSLVRILAHIPSATALKLLRSAARDAEVEVRDAAVRALVDWPESTAMPDLLEFARNAANPLHRTLAFRGYVRLAREQTAAPAAKLKMLAEALPLAATVDDRKRIVGAASDIPLPGAMELILHCLPAAGLEVEAATATVRIAKQMRQSDGNIRSVMEKIRAACQAPAARLIIENALLLLDLENIASRGIASSPDGWEKDGEAGGDQAGIDGNPSTYWDEENGKKIYRYIVTFKQPEKVAALSLLGWAHHNFAPKDFEIVCDGQVVKKVENAQYEDNYLTIGFAEVSVTSVELRITGYYGGSPAIRELGIYRRKKGQ